MKKILSIFIIPCAAASLLHAESEANSPLPNPAAIRFTPPPPPKEVPPMLVKGSASKNFGAYHITILRSEASTLPDIPVPPVRERAESTVSFDAEPNYLISIGGVVYDGHLSHLSIWNQETKTGHEAWCAWDVSLIAPFSNFTIDEKNHQLFLLVQPIDTVSNKRFIAPQQIPAHPEIAPGAILVPDGDESITRLLTHLRGFQQENLTKLLEIREAQNRYREEKALWEKLNPPQPVNHTIWFKPHRGSRYLDKPENIENIENGEEAR